MVVLKTVYITLKSVEQQFYNSGRYKFIGKKCCTSKQRKRRCTTIVVEIEYFLQSGKWNVYYQTGQNEHSG